VLIIGVPPSRRVGDGGGGGMKKAEKGGDGFGSYRAKVQFASLP